MENNNVITGKKFLEVAQTAKAYKNLFESKYDFDPWVGFANADPHDLDLYKSCGQFLSALETAYKEFTEDEDVRKELL